MAAPQRPALMSSPSSALRVATWLSDVVGGEIEGLERAYMEITAKLPPTDTGAFPPTRSPLRRPPRLSPPANRTTGARIRYSPSPGTSSVQHSNTICRGSNSSATRGVSRAAMLGASSRSFHPADQAQRDGARGLTATMTSPVPHSGGTTTGRRRHRYVGRPVHALPWQSGATTEDGAGTAASTVGLIPSTQMPGDDGRRQRYRRGVPLYDFVGLVDSERKMGSIKPSRPASHATSLWSDVQRAAREGSTTWESFYSDSAATAALACVRKAQPIRNASASLVARREQERSLPHHIVGGSVQRSTPHGERANYTSFRDVSHHQRTNPVRSTPLELEPDVIGAADAAWQRRGVVFGQHTTTSVGNANRMQQNIHTAVRSSLHDNGKSRDARTFMLPAESQSISRRTARNEIPGAAWGDLLSVRFSPEREATPSFVGPGAYQPEVPKKSTWSKRGRTTPRAGFGSASGRFLGPYPASAIESNVSSAVESNVSPVRSKEDIRTDSAAAQPRTAAVARTQRAVLTHGMAGPSTPSASFASSVKRDALGVLRRVQRDERDVAYSQARLKGGRRADLVISHSLRNEELEHIRNQVFAPTVP